MNPSIIGIWGAPGTIKSTLAATWPMGIGWHEFDIGGFERGSAYLNEEQKAGITLHQYHIPIRLTMEKEMGHALEGWMEMWAMFLKNIQADLRDPNIHTLVYDTGTLCWQACHRAYLQMLQKTKPNRENLMKEEYGDVNPWMYAVLQKPKAEGKHLVVTFHDAPYYVDVVRNGRDESIEDPSGAAHHAGFSHFTKITDLMLHTFVEDKIPYAAIEDHTNKKIRDVKTGIAPLELVHMKVADPSFDKVDQFITCAKAIKARNLPMPETPESIIEQGQALGAR